jgi:hypothetical protein
MKRGIQFYHLKCLRYTNIKGYDTAINNQRLQIEVICCYYAKLAVTEQVYFCNIESITDKDLILACGGVFLKFTTEPLPNHVFGENKKEVMLRTPEQMKKITDELIYKGWKKLFT